MTGILPIKKYGKHSALNFFREYTMTRADEYAPFIGFTEDEVKKLCIRYLMDFEAVRQWYDGYSFPRCRCIYSPLSVVRAMIDRIIRNNWTLTETWEALGDYIALNLDGLHDKVIRLLAGGRIKVEVEDFSNDMVTINNADNALTLLVHLGYLGYDAGSREVFVPNKEIAARFALAIRNKFSDEYTGVAEIG